MKSTLAPGASRCDRILVDRPRTIGFLGEETRIYSTPSMVGDVEYACMRLVQEHLDEGESSVGIHVEVDHLAATPLGEEVEVEVRVESVEGRRVTLLAEVRDRIEIVGRGRHVRFVIDVARHAERLREKTRRLAAST
jgi:predicted thioesterase